MRHPQANDDEPGLFLDDEEHGGPVPGAANAVSAEPGGNGAPDQLPPWRILIVDDDVDVHVVTKFALSTARFQGRRLSFVHAYSAAEALAKLRETGDIALILLDVMMETTDAGLQLARQIREEGNDLVRIVLRTGQPGQAVEHSIIVDYDINDFWSKADLTTRKLFTTVIAALRAYATLARAAAARDQALARLAAAEKQLQAARMVTAVLRLDGEGRLAEANEAGPALAIEPGRALLDRAALDAIERDGAWSGELQLAGSARSMRCAATRHADGGFTMFVSPLA
jgi:CheY-like chemotaxis protein